MNSKYRHRNRLGALSLLWLFSLSASAATAISGESGLYSAEQAIRAEELIRKVQELASPEMEGRSSGTPGEARASDYIAREFRRIGLKPAGDQGGYLQSFEITLGVKLEKDNRLALEIAGRPVSYRAEVAFIPFGFSDEGSLSGELIFAGYGITAPELNYDDYAGIDAGGKIVLVLTHEPQEKNPQSPFRRPEAFRYTEVRYKAWNAREHGARGIIIVTDPNSHSAEREELFAIRGSGSASAGIAAVNVMRSVADEILRPTGKELSRLQREIDQTLSPRSFPIPRVTAYLQIGLVREKGRAANVVGILPGKDSRLREEAIVIGAHYDALGRGGEHSLSPTQYGEIHSGADDNASGVAGVLSLAEAFASSGVARTLVFVAFSGEEMGLLGSSHYVKNPAWPLDKSYVMINLDMIGRMEKNRIYIMGVDSAKELRSVVHEAVEGLELQPSYSGDGYGPSDHTSFYANGTAVLMFFTGPHSDYHRPSDTSDKINREGLRQVVRLVFRTVASLADRVAPLTFVRTESPPRTLRDGPGGYGAYFGSIPDFSESPVPGVRITGVRPGSPAEKAGLQGDDIIVRFAGITIRNLDDLVLVLRSKRPEDQVEVLYLREGAELKAQATLGDRAESREKHLANVKQLTFGGQNAEAYFSSDGAQLIFQSTRPPFECDQIFTMDVDGSNVKLMSTGKGRTTCSFFSPDQKRFIYASTHLSGEACPPEPDRKQGYVWPIYTGYDIFSANLDGSDLRRLTASPGYDAEGIVSADGKRIVFTSMRGGDLDIYVMNVDGTGLKRLTTEKGYDGGPFFSWDGSRIVYRAFHPRTKGEIEEYETLLGRNLVKPARAEIFVMDADGANRRQLTDNGAANWAPFMHPNNRQVIFSSNLHDPERRTFSLYLINTDGSGLERITYGARFDSFPMFSKDGEKLVFASTRNAKAEREFNIFIADWMP